MTAQPVIPPSNLPDFRTIGTTTFFVASTPATGTELWKTDGTVAGTVLVEDIVPGPDGSNPTALTSVNGWLVFQACEASGGCAVWQSDGTADGTRQLADVAPGGSASSLSGFTVAGSLIYVTTEELPHGRALWAIPTSALEQVSVCVGDCKRDQHVTIEELLTLVNIALGNAQPSACPHGVPSGADVNVALIIQAVNNALSGCGGSPAEQGCLTSGGTVTSAMCCASSGDFPDTCAIGACGCFDGSECVWQ